MAQKRGGLEVHLDEMVAVSRRRLAAQDADRAAISERDAVARRILKEDNLSAREAARVIRERLEADGFTPEQIRVLGVSEANLKPLARG